MKGIRFLIAALLIGWLPGSSRAEDWAAKMFETLEHDFGVVARGAKAEYRFVFKNIYMEDVHVQSARSTCGCTLVRVENPLLKTYETGAIVATVNSRAFIGSKGATITVVFDRPYYAEVQLRVRSYIRSDIVFEPEAVNFGNVDSGNGAEQVVTINYSGSRNWRITDVISPAPYITTSLSEPIVSGSQIMYRLNVRLQENAPVGSLANHLILKTNDRTADSVPLQIEGTVVAPISVTPGTLFLGLVKPGDKVSKQLVVRSKRPIRITNIDCEPCAGSLEADLSRADKPATVHVIPITYTAGEESGRVVVQIHIHTDSEGATEMPLRATAVAVVQR